MMCTICNIRSNLFDYIFIKTINTYLMSKSNYIFIILSYAPVHQVGSLVDKLVAHLEALQNAQERCVQIWGKRRFAPNLGKVLVVQYAIL